MNDIQKLERELFDTYQKLVALRAESEPQEVKNYIFQTLEGEVTLLELFAGKETLFLIHNMGQGCRYCTLWADGINGFLPHLESRFAVAMVSKDDPETQRRMANERGWRYRMVSHGGGDYIREQSVGKGNNYPGLVCYVREDERVYRKNRVIFGPGDEFCSLWNIISLAGIDENNWTPQFSYWKRPQKLDDGGENPE